LSVAAINQLIPMLSIPAMQNLERNIGVMRSDGYLQKYYFISEGLREGHELLRDLWPAKGR
jgi:hypothetical protein